MLSSENATAAAEITGPADDEEEELGPLIFEVGLAVELPGPHGGGNGDPAVAARRRAPDDCGCASRVGRATCYVKGIGPLASGGGGGGEGGGGGGGDRTGKLLPNVPAGPAQLQVKATVDAAAKEKKNTAAATAATSLLEEAPCDKNKGKDTVKDQLKQQEKTKSDDTTPSSSSSSSSSSSKRSFEGASDLSTLNTVLAGSDAIGGAPVAAMWKTYDEIPGTTSTAGGTVDLCDLYALPCQATLGAGRISTEVAASNVLSTVECLMNKPVKVRGRRRRNEGARERGSEGAKGTKRNEKDCVLYCGVCGRAG